MWLLVTFDLPMEEPLQQKHYRTYVKLLKSNGFSNFQKSLFIRWVESPERTATILRRIKTKAPPQGKVFIMKLAEETMNKSLTIEDGIISSSPIKPDPWHIH